MLGGCHASIIASSSRLATVLCELQIFVLCFWHPSELVLAAISKPTGREHRYADSTTALHLAKTYRAAAQNHNSAQSQTELSHSNQPASLLHLHHRDQRARPTSNSRTLTPSSNAEPPRPLPTPPPARTPLVGSRQTPMGSSRTHHAQPSPLAR